MGDMYDIALGDGGQEQRGMLFGYTLLNIKREEFGRFRDAWLEDVDGELRVAVYTRNGGGNRPDYQEQIKGLQAHPCYLSDKDDEFDSTYATFYFRLWPVLPAHLAELEKWKDVDWPGLVEGLRETAVPPIDTDQRWHDAIARLEKDGPTERQASAFAPLGEALKSALEGNSEGGIIYIGDSEEETP